MKRERERETCETNVVTVVFLCGPDVVLFFCCFFFFHKVCKNFSVKLVTDEMVF